MDKKLEISGSKTNGDPPAIQATYRQLPEADMEDEEVLSRPKSLVKVKTSSETDGADEKMLPEEDTKVTINSNLDHGDAKVSSGDKQNGDAKLDIDGFNQFQKRGLLTNKPVKKLTALDENAINPIVSVKVINGQYGEVILVELEENVFLPKRVTDALKPQIKKIKSQKYALVFQGLKDICKPTPASIFDIVEV